jgi:hypothetical protein
MASKPRPKRIRVPPVTGRPSLGELLKRIWTGSKPRPKPVPVQPITGPTKPKPSY